MLIFHSFTWKCSDPLVSLQVNYLVKTKAAERSFLRQEVAQSRRAADVGGVGRVALDETVRTQEKKTVILDEISYTCCMRLVSKIPF